MTTVTNTLTAAGIDRIHVRAAATALNALPFLTMGWTFGYIASVGALLAVVAAPSLGAAVGLVASALSAPRLDPAPWLAPTPEPSWWAFGAYSLGSAVLVVAVAGWLAVRGVRTAKVGELIRYS